MSTRNSFPPRALGLVFLLVLAAGCLFPRRVNAEPVNVESVRVLDSKLIPPEQRAEATEILPRAIEAQRLAEIQRENAAWAKVTSAATWEQFRAPRIQALKDSLGTFPTPGPLKAEVTSTIAGDGYRIENLVFESRPGLWVTANLYAPAKPPASMPAILFAHSHHNPKTQVELQDMGMTWARNGWMTLVMDLLGHGERRQHPFVSADQYPQEFRLSRQDYYFRYNTGLQLSLVGESLMGYFAYDLMRGVDLVLSRPGVDKDRIILIGAVAGGGDPAAVTAALDPRIAAVAPFNFGGPQPDYAIPADTENEFYWFGVAWWEMTRCLRLGGQGGFAHWTIVSSVAPRRLIYSYEFGLPHETDPAWPRIEKVFSLCGVRDNLGVAEGQGNLKGRPPENTHCNNVGPIHRAKLYPYFERWFGMKPPASEFSDPRQPSELACMTPAAMAKLKPQSVAQLTSRLAQERTTAARQALAKQSSDQRRAQLQRDWTRLLGETTPAKLVDGQLLKELQTESRVSVSRTILATEEGIRVPVTTLIPIGKASTKLPVVVMVSSAGKAKLLADRAETIAAMLNGGAAVVLPDLRGTGETSPGSSAGPNSIGTTLSCRAEVLGVSILGGRVRDLRAVLAHVREQKAFDPQRIALWGDSPAAPNAPDRNIVVPHGVGSVPTQAEPMGALAALLTALYEPEVKAVYAAGMVNGYQSLLTSPFLYVPHDTVIPGALATGDLGDVAAVLAPRPLRLVGLVDGTNRTVTPQSAQQAFAPTTAAYAAAENNAAFSLSASPESPAAAADWLLAQLKAG